MIDYKQLTDRDIRRFEEEINSFRLIQRKLLIIGWVLMGASIIVFNAAVILGVYDRNYIMPLSVLCSFLFCGGLTCFILRGALYNPRIKNRLDLIRQYKEYRSSRREYDQ